MKVLHSLLGVVFLLGVAFLFSENRKAINWRTVAGALFLQVAFAGFVLATPFGRDALTGASYGVQQVMNYADDGINFLFGSLADQSKAGFIFAVKVLPMIVFFSALISVLYHLGVMQAVIRFFGGGMQKFLDISRTEAISATGNIFVGQTEAPLLVGPYVPQMTHSQLFAVMVGGLASIAGSVLAGYASLGVDLGYLIAASFMAAPGGLLMAKILVPETGAPEEISGPLDRVEHVNILDAAATGASSGMQLAMNVGATLLAFIALIALLNGFVNWFGSLIGHDGLDIQEILGYLFAPVAWLLGVPWSEVNLAGSLIGQKLVVNEFVAFVEFIDIKGSLTPVTQAVMTFTLCGFANFASTAVLLAGLGGIAPDRRADIANLGLKAVLGGTLSNLMSGTLAGLFI